MNTRTTVLFLVALLSAPGFGQQPSAPACDRACLQ